MKLLLILFCINLSLAGICQSPNTVELLKKNKIKTINYIIEKYDEKGVKTDVIKNKKSILNKEGFPVKTYIYNSKNRISTYEKEYANNDTLLLKMNTYFGKDSLFSTAYFEYNELRKCISEKHYINGEVDLIAKTKYDKGLRKKHLVKYKMSPATKIKYEYNKNKQLWYTKKKRANKKNTIKYYYNKKGQLIGQYQVGKQGRERWLNKFEYDQETGKKTKITSRYYSNRTIINESGKQKVKNGDTISKTYFYKDNGLVDLVKLFRNDQLERIVRFQYDSF